MKREQKLRVFPLIVQTFDGGKSKTSVVRDDPDSKEEHDKRDNGIDDEDNGKAGEVQDQRVEARVEAAAQHCCRQTQAAAQRPEQRRRRRYEVERTNLVLLGNISLLMMCITGLMPKAWLMNITMVISRGERPRVGLMARRSLLQWE